jgi:hypothetical protein
MRASLATSARSKITKKRVRAHFVGQECPTDAELLDAEGDIWP